MRFIHPTSLLILLLCFMTACQSQTSRTPFPTYTLYPTYTPFPTYTPLPTYTRSAEPSSRAQAEGLTSKPASEPSSQSALTSAEIESLVWPTGPRDDVIPFTDAANFIGENLTVEGTIVRTHNSGNAVFLNFAEDFANTFTAVIFPDDWSKFSAPPEDLFYGKLVRIEGVIEEYQGAPEIIITEPWQIEVALRHGDGQPVITDCNCQEQDLSQEAPALLTRSATQPASAAQVGPTLPPPTTTEPQPTVTPQLQIISWEDAAAYQGQTMTVEGQVIGTFNSGKVVFLNFHEDFRNTFTVAIFPDAWPLFPAPPEDYYHNKRVRVTGLIKMYQNSPEIIVENPNQIEIME